jgi:hypothetical protein
MAPSILNMSLPVGVDVSIACSDQNANAAGCEKIFAEKVSSVAQRLELDAALDYDISLTCRLYR